MLLQESDADDFFWHLQQMKYPALVSLADSMFSHRPEEEEGDPWVLLDSESGQLPARLRVLHVLRVLIIVWKAFPGRTEHNIPSHQVS